MGVNSRYYLMVGIKEEYNYIRSYKSKNDSDYVFDLEYGDTEDYINIVFDDHLPPHFKCISDGMCGEYSIIGKVLQSSEYIDEIYSMSISTDKLSDLTEEVYNELRALNLDVKKENIKLHSFVYFS